MILIDDTFSLITMNFSLHPLLENDYVALVPLSETDFEPLYAAASDEKIWEQHPNKDRWKREVFQLFFEGAVNSKGAFKIVDKQTGEIIGSTRFYDYDEEASSILIGYTFYATKYWGKGINPAVKKMMLDYIFQYVDTVYLHVGADNIRSQTAVERIGGVSQGKREVAYYGEPSRTNVVYQITKESWLSASGNS